MTDSELTMKLAKVIIAAAWADGEVHDEEINQLKRVLLNLRRTSTGRGVELSGKQWATLQMYIESPVEDAERARLVGELASILRSGREREFVGQTLREVLTTDGHITTAEEEVLREIEAALDEAGSGRFNRLGRLFGGAASPTRSTSAAPNREDYFEDLLRNRVYYNLARRGGVDAPALNLSETEQRKLGLAGGLMAKIAHIDGALGDEEFERMTMLVRRHWSLSPEAAAFVVETAVDTVDQTFDTVRMMAELGRSVSIAERRQFLAALFALAASDGEVSIAEHEEIRFIARGIDLGHDEFIAAKLQALAGDDTTPRPPA